MVTALVFDVRPGRESFQGILQLGGRVKAVKPGGAEQALDDGSAFVDPFGADEEIIFPAYGNQLYRWTRNPHPNPNLWAKHLEFKVLG